MATASAIGPSARLPEVDNSQSARARAGRNISSSTLSGGARGPNGARGSGTGGARGSGTSAAAAEAARHPGGWAACCTRPEKREENRVAHINHPESNAFGNNFITTSKYSLLSFFPRSLFEQFRRIANVYFLVISVLMLLGTYVTVLFESPLSAYSTLGPLALVLAITMVKEGVEDYKRHASDHAVNNRTCPVVQADGSEKAVPWKELHVGMVIRVDNKGEVPADVIVVQTSEPRSACYIETSNIDGETNLKLKEAVAAASSYVTCPADAGRLLGVIEYEGPNDRIHTFTGRMQIGTNNYAPVGARNMVLRGCTLRNTHWMLGLVVYTGRDTKVMKKSGGARSKMSQVEKTMNMCIKVIFGAQAVLCTVATIAYALWDAQYGTPPYVMQSASSTVLPTWLGNWFTFLILFNNFIPISLYVTVEMVNYAQAWLIDNDRAMYDPESNTPAKARTSNLNQDLGQIEYVFSDKTGTLTRNVMEFKQCSVGGRVYGVFVPEADGAGGAEDTAEAADATTGFLGSWRDCFSCCCSRGGGVAGTAGSAPGTRGRKAGGGRNSPAGVEMSASGAGATRRAANPYRDGPAGSPPPHIRVPAGGGGDSEASGDGSAGVLSPVASGFDDPALLGLLRFNSGSGGKPVPLGWGAEWTPAIAAAAGAQAAADPRSAGFPLPTAGAGLAPSGSGSGGKWPAPAGSAHVLNPMPAHNGASPEAVVALEAFFTCMAVCHTVVPEANEKDKGAPAVYQAESPDEAALTKAARDAGFEFVSRAADSVVVARRNGERRCDLKFMVHGVHEFNSTRKRMSVVCQAPDGRYFIMVKGADNVIFERALPEPHRRELETHLTRFASDGLRTLVLAQREMSGEEFRAWKEEYMLAAMALHNREELLAAVAERHETALHVLGATAIEDRLQDGVPGTIRDLARAGIKTWVLTGDKVETAINIGFSCRLLDASMEMIKITAEEERTVVTQLALLEKRFHELVHQPRGVLGSMGLLGAGWRAKRESAKDLSAQLHALSTPASGVSPAAAVAAGIVAPNAMAGVRPSVAGADAIARNPMGAQHSVASDGAEGDGGMDAAAVEGLTLTTNMSLVITGLALSHIIGNEARERALLTVARCCRAVIACRVSPQQKANIVRMVRRGIVPHPMTLAIGDGANDVGMIQRAEVGVGISGKEGLQAVNSADFAIAQFRFLRRLLLVHGRWDYRRMTKVVLYSFYKNVVITLSLFYYTALTGFSGTSFYESLVYSTYNFVLGLPIIFAGILDRDISASTALAHPFVYAVGLRYEDLNLRKIGTWIWWACIHSVIVFWTVFGVMGVNMGDPARPVENGWSKGAMQDGMAVAGLTQFCVLVWAMQFEVSMQTVSWTWLNYLMLALSMGLFYVFLLVYGTMQSFAPEFYGVAMQTFARPDYWLVILLTLGMMAVVDYTTELVRRMYFPTSSDIAMELDRGWGVKGADGAVRWGDEDTVGPAAGGGSGGAEATASGVAVRAGTGTSVAVQPRKEAVTPGVAGSISAATTQATRAELAAAAARASMHPSHLAGGRSRPRQDTHGGGSGSGFTASASVAPISGSASASSLVHTGVTPLRPTPSGTVTVPTDYVLGDLDARGKEALGVVDPSARRSAYDYEIPGGQGRLRQRDMQPSDSPPVAATSASAESVHYQSRAGFGDRNSVTLTGGAAAGAGAAMAQPGQASGVTFI